MGADVLCSNVLHLCKGKFSSNVVEKCIVLANADGEDETRLHIGSSIAQKMMDEKVDGEYIVEHLIKDKFGNLTVARLIKHCNHHDQDLVRSRMDEVYGQIPESNKKIFEALKEKFDME